MNNEGEQGNPLETQHRPAGQHIPEGPDERKGKPVKGSDNSPEGRREPYEQAHEEQPEQRRHK